MSVPARNGQTRYRHVARAALMEGNLESLWLGARNTFERFSVSDPLLFVGGQRVRVQVDGEGRRAQQKGFYKVCVCLV